jgi:hypothetical protein
MTNPFQLAVTHNSPRATREAAIETLTEANRTTDLAVLVRTSGLPGGLRRQAVDGLISSNATDLLEELAADRSVAPELRKKARR